MTIQAEVPVYSQVFVPRDYEVFAGLDVDHHSIAATFTDHDRLMQSVLSASINVIRARSRRAKRSWRWRAS